MEVKKFDNLELYQDVAMYAALASAASEKAKKENKELKLPSPISINGEIFYEMPNGEIIPKHGLKQ